MAKDKLTRFKKIIEKGWGQKLFKWLYRFKFFKRRIDPFLDNLVTAPFQFGAKYKYSQTKHLLVMAPKGSPWEFAIRSRRKQWKSKRDYNFTILFKTEKYNVLKMVRK